MVVYRWISNGETEVCIANDRAMLFIDHRKMRGNIGGNKRFFNDSRLSSRKVKV